ncbi:hypothetical protein K7432_006528 [Basidiobolus ranarum]|uniref:Uncharacterized protein n=1 Tax=Basidiobolus ranarum TaxID=34480 RepID=A0ABR2WUR0_9FUNG
MSCDLSDPAIGPAYEEVATGQGANWLILGYHDSRDKVSLYTKGTGGLEEFKAHLTDEVLYGYLNYENTLIFVTYISEDVSGIRRARAFVHGKHVATVLNKHDVYYTASSLADLTESNIQARILPKNAEATTDSETQPLVEETINPPDLVESTPETPAESMPTAVPEDSPGVDQIPMADPPSESPLVPIPHSSDGVESVEGELQSPMEEVHTDAVSENMVPDEIPVNTDKELNHKPSAPLHNDTVTKPLTKDPETLETERIFEENLKKREVLRKQVLESENSGNVTSLAGYITIQGGGVYFWKRRWYTLCGNVLYLYRDEKDKCPLSSIDMGVGINRIEDARSEVLIPNSFKVELPVNEVYHFFADTSEEKAKLIDGFSNCVATH